MMCKVPESKHINVGFRKKTNKQTKRGTETNFPRVPANNRWFLHLVSHQSGLHKEEICKQTKLERKNSHTAKRCQRLQVQSLMLTSLLQLYATVKSPDKINIIKFRFQLDATKSTVPIFNVLIRIFKSGISFNMNKRKLFNQVFAIIR